VQKTAATCCTGVAFGATYAPQECGEVRRLTVRDICLVFCIAAALAASAATCAQSDLQTAAPLTVIRAGTLIDGVSEKISKNQLIFVRGERIENVTDGSVAIPAGAKLIDLSAATVLPGLI